MSEYVYPQFGKPAIYVDPLITDFTVSPPIAELGSSVGSVVLRWSLSKTPLGLTLDGVAIPPFQTVTTVTGPFAGQSDWVLKMTDEISSIKSKAHLLFQNKFFWANLASAPTNSMGILAMENSFFATAYGRTLQVGSPNGHKPCFAWPKRFATPRKVLIGTPARVWKADMVDWAAFTDYTVTTVSYTNPSGYTEDYYVLIFDATRDDDSLMVQLV